MKFDFFKQQVGIHCSVLKLKGLVCTNKLSRQNNLNTNSFKNFHIYVVKMN